LGQPSVEAGNSAEENLAHNSEYREGTLLMTKLPSVEDILVLLKDDVFAVQFFGNGVCLVVRAGNHPSA
jgi:hypothetical protein